MMKKIVLLGGGGHCVSVVDTLIRMNEYEDIVILDTIERVGTDVLGVKVVGTEKDLYDLKLKGFQYGFITVGSVGDSSLRHKLLEIVKKYDFVFPNVIDKDARVSPFAELKSGIYIGKNAVVNANVIIENNTIINTGAIIEHECKIGEFTHIAPGATLCGRVCVGDDTHIGANATVIQNINIGEHTIIGAGSVITRNVGPWKKVVGNPGREV